MPRHLQRGNAHPEDLFAPPRRAAANVSLFSDHVYVWNLSAEKLLHPLAGDFSRAAFQQPLAGSIQEIYFSLQIGGNQTTAHGIDDVFMQRLQIL